MSLPRVLPVEDDTSTRRRVELALATTRPDGPADEAPLGLSASTPPRAEPVPDRSAAAIALYFSGDDTLFRAYEAACQKQFGQDLQAGEAARARADLQALRHVAHNLKSVLLTLGHATLADHAAAAELGAGCCDDRAAWAAWRLLHDGLRRLGPPSAA